MDVVVVGVVVHWKQLRRPGVVVEDSGLEFGLGLGANLPLVGHVRMDGLAPGCWTLIVVMSSHQGRCSPGEQEQ